MSDRQSTVGVAGELIYERILPALPGSVTRMRHELTSALARHRVAADRLADIELSFTEAATNAVVHAYSRCVPGPLYAAASLVGDAVSIWVSDAGRGMRSSTGVAGAGLGLTLMRQLSDELRICGDEGTCVQATFDQAAFPERRRAAKRARDRAELLSEYLRVQGAVSESLREDTQAVLAQAKQALAHARRRQQERADEQADLRR